MSASCASIRAALARRVGWSVIGSPGGVSGAEIPLAPR
jgi:hypothetical protein